MLYMAGQLGLDPPTMALVPGGAGSEMKQAVKNCEAVAQVFSASIVHSSVSILIYCSMSAGISERKEAAQVLEKFLWSSEEGVDVGVSCLPAVPILYVQLPALPKGAAREVEPFLYVPSHSEESVKGSLKRLKRGESCQGTIVSEHLLRAFFSVPNRNKYEVTPSTEIFSVQSLAFLCGELELCLQTFSELLAEASFNWENVLALRVMFTSKLVSRELVGEAWKYTVNKALSSSTCTTQDKLSIHSSTSGLRCLEPLFLPVLGTGNDMNMDDLITLDLLAFS